MDQGEFVSAVQQAAGLHTPDEVEATVHATLRALGERLSGGETKDLAAQMPGAFSRGLPAQGAGERFSIEEFYRRVAEYEPGDHSPQDGRRHARAVVAALKASVTGGEFDDIADQLPKEYDDLLGTGPVQH